MSDVECTEYLKRRKSITVVKFAICILFNLTLLLPVFITVTDYIIYRLEKENYVVEVTATMTLIEGVQFARFRDSTGIMHTRLHRFGADAREGVTVQLFVDIRTWDIYEAKNLWDNTMTIAASLLIIATVMWKIWSSKDVDRCRKCCIEGGLIVDGRVIELNDHKYLKYIPKLTKRQLVAEYDYDGQMKKVKSDWVKCLPFSLGDKVEVYIHPTDEKLAHVYLALDATEA
jgi:hypothetical protein